MAQTVTLIGFGEAGTCFADAGRWGDAARVFDKKTDQALLHDATMREYERSGVIGCETIADAAIDAPTILSLVTADQALAAAEGAAHHLRPGALYCDMNSVAPQTKREAAAAIEAAGGRYVDVAIMAPVNPARMNVPLLVSGPEANAAVATLIALGFTHLRAVGDDVGRAATIKMMRSVIYKGLEALTAECVMACQRAGVLDEVSESLGINWGEKANYRMDRIMTHGTRRAAEMEEVVKTLEGLGVDAVMTRGTVARQREIGSRGIVPVPEGLSAKLERLVAK
jgi:3-hydroxyisobutyrate dehydrogenase-like beta-hydroxyacid dehydrogenase